jgi:hypothetical protein
VDGSRRAFQSPTFNLVIKQNSVCLFCRKTSLEFYKTDEFYQIIAEKRKISEKIGKLHVSYGENKK